MTYKRYIKRGNKIYGPYTYQSRKVKGKVISEYKGKLDDKKRKNFLPIFVFLTLVIVLLVSFFTGDVLTGRVTLLVEDSYREGGEIAGNFKVTFKQGELIPASTRVLINNAGEETEFVLSDLISESTTEGNFYVEGKEISGSGEGYGVAGEKIIYPEVFFTLNVVSQEEQEPLEEIPITGQVVVETGIEVEGQVSAEKPFTYTPSRGREFSLKQGSVRSEDKELSDDVISIEIGGRKVTVTTEYMEKEEGFGEEYLGDETFEIVVDLSQLNLIAREGELEIKLVYDDVEIASASILQQVIELEVVNETIQEKVEENITDVTLPIPVNVSIENITEENITIQNITNFTIPIQNITNITITQNITNVTILENVTNMTIETTQYEAKIGEPVKWLKKVKLEQEEKNITIELPKNVSNVRVDKIANDVREDITDKVKVKEKDRVKVAETNLITGATVVEKRENWFTKLLKWFSSVTGFSVVEEDAVDIVEEEENPTEIIIEDTIEEIEIEYETEAPRAFEEILGSGKRITVVGPEDIHYENILAFTELPMEVLEQAVHLYWLVNDTREEVTTTKYDMNNNSLIDYIEWITPYLSNQTYELEIVILNVQSYPMLGGNWTVMFNTTGMADLIIKAINGTRYNEANNSDLEFLEIRRGDKVVNEVILIDNKNRTMPYEAYVLRRRIKELMGG